VKSLTPELRAQLAGEYVLGTLRGAARRRFERQCSDDPHLRQEVELWERRLAPLADRVRPVTPPQSVWRRVSAAIGAAHAPDGSSLWDRVAFWRGLSLAATAAAAALLAIVLFPPAEPPVPAPSHVAVLHDQSQQPAWIVRARADAGSISVERLAGGVPPPGRSYEVWLIRPANPAPVSIGVLAATRETHLRPPPSATAHLASAAAAAISLEPAGGSPTGAPTGPVLFVGPLVAANH
jgi:anti-sigma-K factor RskA